MHLLYMRCDSSISCLRLRLAKCAAITCPASSLKLVLSQAVPLYLSEISPAHARGTLNIMFQMATTIGIWAAQWINYGTKDMHPHGWRLSVGLAIVPGLILFLGSLIIPDTPNSLVLRGKVEQARRTLERVRGTAAVDAEFADIVEAVENGQKVNKFAIFQRKYRPVLVSNNFCPVFVWFAQLNFDVARGASCPIALICIGPLNCHSLSRVQCYLQLLLMCSNLGLLIMRY